MKPPHQTSKRKKSGPAKAVHGTRHHAYKNETNFSAAGGAWTAGIDYRAPTGASCKRTVPRPDFLQR